MIILFVKVKYDYPTDNTVVAVYEDVFSEPSLKEIDYQAREGKLGHSLLHRATTVRILYLYL